MIGCIHINHINHEYGLKEMLFMIFDQQILTIFQKLHRALNELPFLYFTLVSKNYFICSTTSLNLYFKHLSRFFRDRPTDRTTNQPTNLLLEAPWGLKILLQIYQKVCESLHMISVLCFLINTLMAVEVEKAKNSQTSKSETFYFAIQIWD